MSSGRADEAPDRSGIEPVTLRVRHPATDEGALHDAPEFLAAVGAASVTVPQLADLESGFVVPQHEVGIEPDRQLPFAVAQTREPCRSTRVPLEELA